MLVGSFNVVRAEIEKADKEDEKNGEPLIRWTDWRWWQDFLWYLISWRMCGVLAAQLLREMHRICGDKEEDSYITREQLSLRLGDKVGDLTFDLFVVDTIAQTEPSVVSTIAQTQPSVVDTIAKTERSNQTELEQEELDLVARLANVRKLLRPMQTANLEAAEKNANSSTLQHDWRMQSRPTTTHTCPHDRQIEAEAKARAEAEAKAGEQAEAKTNKNEPLSRACFQEANIKAKKEAAAAAKGNLLSKSEAGMQSHTQWI